jgi:hypothetical protein
MVDSSESPGALAADLETLEQSIRKLQIEWDRFFGGVERIPPHDLKRRTDQIVRRHAGTEIQNSALRFRFLSLSSRYATYNELWQKRLRAVEEGRPWHGGRVPPPAAMPAPAKPKAAEAGSGFRVRNQLGDAETVKKLFDQFVDARQALGEGGGVRFESFQKLIAQQTGRILSEKGAQAVDFRLETKDGKVSLKAKPVKK